MRTLQCGYKRRIISTIPSVLHKRTGIVEVPICHSRWQCICSETGSRDICWIYDFHGKLYECRYLHTRLVGRGASRPYYRPNTAETMSFRRSRLPQRRCSKAFLPFGDFNQPRQNRLIRAKTQLCQQYRPYRPHSPSHLPHLQPLQVGQDLRIVVPRWFLWISRSRFQTQSMRPCLQRSSVKCPE